MPTDFRFDDLDLREQPASADRAHTTVYNTGAPPAQDTADLSVRICTQVCCV
jgi:hypothetical protein